MRMTAILVQKAAFAAWGPHSGIIKTYKWCSRIHWPTLDGKSAWAIPVEIDAAMQIQVQYLKDEYVFFHEIPIFSQIPSTLSTTYICYLSNVAISSCWSRADISHFRLNCAHVYCRRNAVQVISCSKQQHAQFSIMMVQICLAVLLSAVLPGRAGPGSGPGCG
jgi:hypothetical protein